MLLKDDTIAVVIAAFTLPAPYNAEIFFSRNQETKRIFFNLKSSQIFRLALSALFEYLCYGSMAIIF